MFLYFMMKFNTHHIEGMYVDTKALKKIHEMTITDRKTKIVFMPVYRSFADLFVLHYINYISDIEFGFTFGYYRDTP